MTSEDVFHNVQQGFDNDVLLHEVRCHFDGGDFSGGGYINVSPNTIAKFEICILIDQMAENSVESVSVGLQDFGHQDLDQSNLLLFALGLSGQ